MGTGFGNEAPGGMDVIVLLLLTYCLNFCCELCLIVIDCEEKTAKNKISKVIEG
jgi:hypothetical protein